jgi:hypothetical protein
MMHDIVTDPAVVAAVTTGLFGLFIAALTAALTPLPAPGPPGSPPPGRNWAAVKVVVVLTVVAVAVVAVVAWSARADPGETPERDAVRTYLAAVARDDTALMWGMLTVHAQGEWHGRPPFDEFWGTQLNSVALLAFLPVGHRDDGRRWVMARVRYDFADP